MKSFFHYSNGICRRIETNLIFQNDQECAIKKEKCVCSWIIFISTSIYSFQYIQLQNPTWSISDYWTFLASSSAALIICTVLPRTNQANPILCTKESFLNGRYQNLKMLPQLSLQISNLPLMRALKWGTVWPCTSRGIRNTTGQS